MSQLENDIELHRRIVAAADRLAKDQKTNKSVRKKRVKDLQAAAARLKGMELQLAQLRFSASKPDLSQSQNGWTTPASKRTQAQSCPTTPHGSIPDLRDELDDDEVDRVDAQSRGTQPSSAERRRPSSQNHPSPHTNHHQNDQNGHYNPHQHQHPAHQPPLYENVGYRSAAPYQSAYRQSHYPTLHEQQISRQRAKSEHSLHGGNRNPIIAADWTPTKEKQVERTIPIMTAPPAVVRSMQTSHSCSAGFSTASLDRKTLRNRTPPEGSPTPGERESRALGPPHSNPSRDHSPSTHRVTTFPVGTKGMCYETTKPLPSSPLAAPRILQPHRFPNTHSAPHFPPFQPQGVMRPVSSSGRMPAVREDPHMEALLDFYKSAEGARKTKTATIV
ncbi:unnamed protein product, partial [Mesorhabditis spiculigera]